MGVNGFTTFFKGSPAGKSLPLSDLAKDKKLVIGVDGNALFYFLADNILTSSGSYVNLRNEIVKYFETLLKFNIEPVVFLDGLSPIGKYQELEMRFQSKLSELRKVSDNLLNSEPFPFISTPTIKLISVQFRRILEELNIQTYVAFQEADYEVTQWAVDNKDRVFGIISNDSDYYFFTMGECYFIPLNNLKVTDDSITAIGFKSRITADYLQIQEKHLPLLATLIGNDYTKYLKSKYVGSPQSRISSIINNLKKSKNLSPVSILKESFRTLSKTDLDNCLNSYSYYSVRDEPKSDRLGFYSENGIFFRYSQHSDYERISAKPYYKRFFSVACMVNYNYLSLLYSHMNQVSSFCFEPTIPYQNSLIYYTSTLRQLMFGLLDYPPKSQPLKYADLIPDSRSYQKVMMTPIYGEFGMDDCWNGSVPLEKRIYEFASWFKVLNQLKLLEYSKRYSDTAVVIASAKYQCFDDLLVILFSRFLLGLKLCIVIDEWMITDYFATLYFLSYTIVEVMNIPSNIQCHLKSPHQVLDSTNLHLLWQSATKRLVGIPPTTAGNAANRLGHLFPSFKDNITADHLQHFNYLKNEIYSNLKLSNDTTTTTTTTTNQLINEMSTLKV
ncbi:hypothetical protein PPL_05721 [Heterostelium album PN500]|uniref:XPG N-terminal domain-containing protein n=1 Tax=Heterostelium pallidum (strain ATCC 26659 / Pp 5 / PN500) TaxID=670386 RepID=D3BAZ0_HETP5|nr:hypothetical protein PPL_05721 [Heterostelium album PN500]EFA81727.1 hypothetical protein PPL_05721 [Heterostelium album PN500]|eukprot:XP_020433844.1 hypothetical protein PPL_05721 [Heterostelium album PN500]